MPDLLAITSLSAGYGKLRVLDELNLRVAAGGFYALLGPNGSGKSTLVKTIFGLTDRTAGSIQFEGREIGDLPPEAVRRLGLAYVPQRDNVFKTLSVRENLLLSLHQTRRADPEEALVTCFGLFPILLERQHQRAGTLSGGERQMLAIALGWLTAPRLMLLDEPSAGLSPLFVNEVFRTLKDLVAEGLTLVVVEQNARSILRWCDYAFLMREGRIVFAGTAQEILADEETVKSYLGVGRAAGADRQHLTFLEARSFQEGVRQDPMPELSIAFQTDKPLSAYGPLAAQAEAYGFDAVTVYNDMLYQPAWLPLLEMARATSRVRLGVAAINPFTCHPINIAGNLALIDEASGGRAYLGLARGAWLDFVGLHPARPVTALREALECVRHLLRRSPAPYPGDIFSLAGGDSLRWPIFRSDIPFLLGSWGEQAIRACIREIGEVKIGGSANPDVAPHFRRLVDEAAAAAGRRGAEIGIVIGAVSVVDEDGAAARALARREVALYLPVVAELDPTLQIDPELLTRLRAAAARYDFDAAGSLIDDDLLRCFALAGTPAEVTDHVAALFAAGASRVEFGTPHGLTPAVGLRLLGERVLPALRT